MIGACLGVVGSQGGLEGKRDGLEDLDFYMGNDALNHSATHQISYPIRHGLIEVRVWGRGGLPVRWIARNGVLSCVEGGRGSMPGMVISSVSADVLARVAPSISEGSL